MSKIKESTSSLREYIKGIISPDMSKEELDKHEGMLKKLDEIDQENDSQENEIKSCKDKIVSLIRTEGSSNPPREDGGTKTPRTFEEIAQDMFGGK